MPSCQFKHFSNVRSFWQFFLIYRILTCAIVTLDIYIRFYNNNNCNSQRKEYDFLHLLGMVTHAELNRK